MSATPTWGIHVLHSESLRRREYNTIEGTVIQAQLCWLGHVIQMSEERLSRKILYSQLYEGRCFIGGPKKHYEDQMKKAMKCTMNPSNLEICQLCSMENMLSWHFGSTGTRQRRHASVVSTNPDCTCPVCKKQCASKVGFYSYHRTHQ